MRHILPVLALCIFSLSSFAQDSDAFYMDGGVYLQVRYGGGCKEHAFGFTVKNRIERPNWIELWGEIFHTQGEDDPCEAIIQKHLYLDTADYQDERLPTLLHLEGPLSGGKQTLWLPIRGH